MKQRRVLVLCTGNSARSQMAEALINARQPHWQAVSAGTQPADRVNPYALRALDEIGIQPADAKPKHVRQFIGAPFDLVITVCDDANENCPVWLGQGRRIHIGFPDPAKVTGNDQAIMAAFRQVREAIERQIVNRLDDWLAGATPE
jgi:arsenate reductase